MATVLPANDDYIYFVVAQPYDTNLSAQVTLYWSTRSYFFDSTDPTLPNTQFRGWLTQALTSTRSITTNPPQSQVDIGGPSASTSAGGQVQNPPTLIGGRSFPAQAAVILTIGDDFAPTRAYYKTLRWAGWPVTVYRGIASYESGPLPTVGEFQNLQLLLTGTFAADPDYNKTTFSAPVSDLGARLAQIFQPATYGGTGAFDGGTDVAGQFKPDAIGEVFGVQGVWVDTANLWMDLCASGFASVAQVSDGASILTASGSNPPSAGEYYVDSVNGRIRFGSAATYTYRVNFTSNFASGSTQLGSIVSAMLTRAGYSAGQIDAAAFTALNTSRSEAVGWYCQKGESFQDLADYVIAAALCFLTADPNDDGKLTIGKVSLPTITSSSDSNCALVITDRILVPNTFTRTGTTAPASRLDIQVQQNWTTLSDNQIAGAAATADADFARNQWRIVAESNATTVTQYPLSVPILIPTPFQSTSQVAATVGPEWQGILTNRQPQAQCTIAVPPFGLSLGAQVWIDSAVNEVNCAAVVIGVDESANQNQVKLTLWALQE